MALGAYLLLLTPGPLCGSVSCLSPARHESGMVCASSTQPAWPGGHVWKGKRGVFLGTLRKRRFPRPLAVTLPSRSGGFGTGVPN